MKVRFLQPARQELREAVEFFESRRSGLGLEFRDQVYAAVERIQDLPQAWPRLSTNTRRCRVHQFPYGVIYEAGDEEIIIVAVAHSHREPLYWRSRIQET